MRTTSTALPLLIAALLSGGCARRTVLRTHLPVPPQLAARVFPEVVVVSGRTPDETGLADAIAAHLEQSGRGRVERLAVHELDLRRASGGFGPATAILAIEARVQERVPADLGARATACFTERCLAEERPSSEAVLHLRLSDARTGRVLQDLEIRERDRSSDARARRAIALARVRARAIEALDPSQVAVMLPLEDVDDSRVRAAIESLRRGRPRHARQLLDRVVRHASFPARSAGERARILFDLGQALRLEARAAAGIGAPELAAADRAIRGAAMLHPCTLYLDTIDQVAQEREAGERMRELEAAMQANFAMALPDDVPHPPLGYGYAMAP